MYLVKNYPMRYAAQQYNKNIAPPSISKVCQSLSIKIGFISSEFTNLNVFVYYYVIARMSIIEVSSYSSGS